jgi:hypothetical protein
MAIKIKGWHKFQHFKDRRPPWIKLYRDLLDDIVWHDTNAESCKMLISFWLIASENDGILPSNKELAFRLRTTEKSIKSNVSKLSHWLEQDDINMISDNNVISEGYQETRLETETETETEKRQSKSALPLTYQPLDEHFELASQLGINLHSELEIFKDHWKANGERRLDWDATLRNWIKRAASYKAKNTPSQSKADSLKDTADLLTGRTKNVARIVG